VIAHRLATIRNADRIIVLQNGATHRSRATTTTLMALGGLYSKLYNAELRLLRRYPGRAGVPGQRQGGKYLIED
jgi:ABC-type transport system involved in cytochrome bd biosynthesis fused ATPase/permease subunit